MSISNTSASHQPRRLLEGYQASMDEAEKRAQSLNLSALYPSAPSQRVPSSTSTSGNSGPRRSSRPVLDRIIAMFTPHKKSKAKNI